MKQLQCHFTTPEQSKRLLEIGVPANSADCYYYDWAWFPEAEHYGKQVNVVQWDDFNEENRLRENKVYPCWSVGRMMEIDLICNTNRNDRSALETKLYNSIDTRISLVEWCVRVMMDKIISGHYDFSRLED